MKEKLTELFATEEISKAILELGFKEVCLGTHCGFKMYGQGDELLQHKQVYMPGIDDLQQLQQTYNMPSFPICPAPMWSQIKIWFMDKYDIDIVVTKVRHDPEFKFEFSVMSGGK